MPRSSLWVKVCMVVSLRGHPAIADADADGEAKDLDGGLVTLIAAVHREELGISQGAHGRLLVLDHPAEAEDEVAQLQGDSLAHPGAAAVDVGQFAAIDV